MHIFCEMTKQRTLTMGEGNITVRLFSGLAGLDWVVSAKIDNSAFWPNPIQSNCPFPNGECSLDKIFGEKNWRYSYYIAHWLTHLMRVPKGTLSNACKNYNLKICKRFSTANRAIRISAYHFSHSGLQCEQIGQLLKDLGNKFL